MMTPPRKLLTLLTALAGASVIVLGSMGQASITPARSGGGSSGVTTITGTANQVVASASTGAVTLSLPQSIATASIPQFAGVKLGSTLAFSSTAPIIGSGWGATVSAVTGTTAAFKFTITLSNSATTGTLTLPTASNGWACYVDDITEGIGYAIFGQNGSTTTSASFSNTDGTTGSPVPINTSDVIIGQCGAF